MAFTLTASTYVVNTELREPLWLKDGELHIYARSGVYDPQGKAYVIHNGVIVKEEEPNVPIAFLKIQDPGPVWERPIEVFQLDGAHPEELKHLGVGIYDVPLVTDPVAEMLANENPPDPAI